MIRFVKSDEEPQVFRGLPTFKFNIYAGNFWLESIKLYAREIEMLKEHADGVVVEE